MSQSTYKKNKNSNQQKKVSFDTKTDTPSSAAKNGSALKVSGCHNCGSKEHHKRADCPASGRECRACGKRGHFSSVCNGEKYKKSGDVRSISVHSTTVGAFTAAELVDIFVAPKGASASAAQVRFLPDSGAELDAIPREIFRRAFQGVKLAPAASPETATGSPIVTDGTYSATLNWKADDDERRLITATVHVLQDLKQAVLSKSSQKKLGVLPESYPHARVSTLAWSAITNVETDSSPSSSLLFPHLLSRPPAPMTVAALESGVTGERKAADLKNFMTDFRVIFDGVCRPMKGPPCHFELNTDATPVPMRGSRPVAVPLMQKLKDKLELQEKQGIIRKVTEPTAWVHPMVVVLKKCGGIRVTVDFRFLNDEIIRPRFKSLTPFQAVRTIPKDSNTSVSQWASFTPAMILKDGVSDVFDDIPKTRRVVEDILIFFPTYEEHVEAVRQVFSRAKEHSISLNSRKVIFAEPSVPFGGFIVDAEGFRPYPALLSAISQFPTPLNITDLRAFFGLCQQLGNVSHDISSALVPLSPLLKKGLIFEWTSTHDDAFKAARRALSAHHSLAFYDPALPTSLHVDASRLNGLGFLLKKQGADAKWTVVQAGSRFLSSAESRYAMIELECLAAAWGMHKCRQFLEGLPSFE
ncbi:uncharacterized protein LOC124197793 [Daphnia pulex]|uniref:uncharacterized protein LOC124197793 n=1 Tax=Daphnia pulex TaxID=6669 RepID=UPI001EDF3237|nr:uncharacterized protein LOC124197793 [Daphnia pulex]